MSQDAISDETLMAYADGELDREVSQAVEAAVNSNPRVAERLARFTETRAALARIGQARPPEPVPDDVVARVRALLDAGKEDTVVEFPSAPSPRWLPTALAASIALAIGLGTGFYVGDSGSEDPGVSPRDLLNIAGLAPALAELRSGETRNLDTGSVTVIASFRDDQGNVCREFELDEADRARKIVSVACHAGDAWHARLAIAADAANDDSYVPASSLDTLEAYLNAIGAGPALSAEEESQALRALGD